MPTSLALHRIHMVSVFLSVVVLLTGFGLEVKPYFESPRPKPATSAARWCLWLGTLGLLVSVGTGFIQPQRSIFFRETSFALTEHRFLGIWTAIVFVALSVWRPFAVPQSRGMFILVWMAAFWILATQALGGHHLAEFLSHQ